MTDMKELLREAYRVGLFDGLGFLHECSNEEIDLEIAPLYAKIDGMVLVSQLAFANYQSFIGASAGEAQEKPQ